MILLDPLLICVLLVLAWGGYKTATVGLEITDKVLAMAMGLPLGLLWLASFSSLGAHYLPIWLCFGLGLLAMILCGILLKVHPSEEVTSEETELPPFSRLHLAIILSVLIGCIFYAHANQLIEVSSDFWYNYPVSRILAKGGLPARHPFFPWISLDGHFHRQLLTAVLSVAECYDTLRTSWISGLFLLISSVGLWALAIRYISNSARAGVLGVLLLFFGINVGGQVGLMDAPNNGDLLIFSLLGVVLVLLVDIIYKARKHWPITVPKLLLTTLIAGAYGFICETYLIVTLICFGVGCLITCRRRSSTVSTLLISALICILGSLALDGLNDGFVNQIIVRGWHRFAPVSSNDRTDTGTNTASIQPNSTTLAETLHRTSATPAEPLLRFPKHPFLSIRLGADPYRRFSNALNTALFRSYQPPLDNGGYSSIFSYKVLILHWLPTWLLPLTILWALYRHNLCGFMFGLVGIIAYFTPALIDFGPVREADYFRWEFLAGLGAAGLMALFLDDLLFLAGNIANKWIHYTVIGILITFIAANLVGAQRLINNVVIEAQRSSEAAYLILTPWYPKTKDWLLHNKRLELTQNDWELANWLWDHNTRPSVIWKDHSKSFGNLLKCAAFNGLAGALSCEHSSTPVWQMPNNMPHIPNQITTAFEFSQDPTLVAGLGANWLITEKKLPDSYNSASSKPGLELAATFGSKRRYWLFKIHNALPFDIYTELLNRSATTASEPTSGMPSELLSPSSSPSESSPHRDKCDKITEIKLSGLPSAQSWQAGRAYPVRIKASHPIEGWLMGFLQSQTSAGTVTTFDRPLAFWANGQEFKQMLAPPLNEGHFILRWGFYTKNGELTFLAGETKLAYLLSDNIDSNLRVKSIEVQHDRGGLLTLKNIGDKTFDCGGPLRIKWWIWSYAMHSYRTVAANPEGQNLLLKPIPPHGEITIAWSVPEPLPTDFRLDISASAALGQSTIVPRL